ncbi:hypothetical protein KC851_03850 [Candidatus Kaiserbacteria bacterium]|nr:hypothetical protein [Candidatus Kaiserbacteria bacterium]
MKKSRDTIKISKLTLFTTSTLVTMMVLYLYFLNMSVVHVVLRGEHVQKQHKLNTEIAQLEADYIESQHVIATEIAGLNEYFTDTPKVFVSREGASLVFGGN